MIELISFPTAMILVVISLIAFFDWQDCSARGRLQYETKYEGFTCFIKFDDKWYSRGEFENRRNITRLHVNETGRAAE